jgi:hypothetical protein
MKYRFNIWVLSKKTISPATSSYPVVAGIGDEPTMTQDELIWSNLKPFMLASEGSKEC